MLDNVTKQTQPARGQSLLEFALALPVLLILFLGLIEVALALRAQLVLTNANREAARYASRGSLPTSRSPSAHWSPLPGNFP